MVYAQAIKMRMKTPTCLNSKRNEVIAWCSFDVWSCFLLSNHHCCMCYCRQCSLHHINANQVSNDNIHQGLKVVSNDKDIHLLLGVVKEKVGDLLLNMCFTFQNNNCDNIWNVSWATWRAPNSLKDSNVSPSERQRKKKESGYVP
jgi:hypothetical protein